MGSWNKKSSTILKNAEDQIWSSAHSDPLMTVCITLLLSVELDRVSMKRPLSARVWLPPEMKLCAAEVSECVTL